MPFTLEEWTAAIPFETYLENVKAHAELWQHHAEHAEVPEGIRARLADLPGERKVLILTEDWCGDAVRSVPVIVKALEAAPGVTVRLLDIASHEDLINQHLTKGAKAIPVAIVADADGREIGWWGPRPAPLQAILRDRIRELGSPKKEEMGKFYAPIMGWYKKDGGKTTLEEMALLLERS
jgi:Thioredoxin